MLAAWDKKYSKYLMIGHRVDDDGNVIICDGIYVMKTAPEKVKKYFEELNKPGLQVVGKAVFTIL